MLGSLNRYSLLLVLLAASPQGVWAAGEPVKVREPLIFKQVVGWAEDDHVAALVAFRQACAAAPGTGPEGVRAGLKRICALAKKLPDSDVHDRAKARGFFETHFLPFRVKNAGTDGLLTGYFEPELEGSLEPSKVFHVPVLKRPDDLVDVVAATDRAAANAQGRLAAMRKTGNELSPYFTRAEIEGGALKARGLELLYLRDAADAYFMHVQGSGRIRLRDGKSVRIGYAGKNGYPYTSAGAVLISQGAIARGDLTLQSMRAWFHAHPQETPGILQQNKSYIFFELKPAADHFTGPIGAQGTPLTPRRSLAVDPSFHVLGTPIFVSSETVQHGTTTGFHHLLIAQDVGSAIKGPERGDIFWGSGKAAEEIAGRTKNRGYFFVLLPKPDMPPAP